MREVRINKYIRLLLESRGRFSKPPAFVESSSARRLKELGKPYRSRDYGFQIFPG
jgi:hypothetical protein